MTIQLALLLGLVIVFGFLLKLGRPPMPKADQIDGPSIVLAARMVSADPSALDRPQGVAPGYAMMLAMLAKTSLSTTNGLLCMAQPTAGCQQGPFVNLVVQAQATLEILALATVAWIAFVASGSTNVTLVTVGLAFWGGRYGDFVGVLRNFVAYHGVSHLFVAATVLSVRRASAAGLLLAGIMLAGMTALEPVSLGLLPVMALLIGLGVGNAEASHRHRALGIAAFTSGCAVALDADRCRRGRRLHRGRLVRASGTTHG